MVQQGVKTIEQDFQASIKDAEEQVNLDVVGRQLDLATTV
jgi:hypothetical protein